MPKMNEETFELICQRIETSIDGIGTICKEFGLKSKNSFLSYRDKEQSRIDRYARAKEEQAEQMAEEMIRISMDDADDEKPFVGVNHIQRDRLKIDTLKFIASKLKPKRFGDKIDVTTNGKELPTTIINLGSGINPTENEATS